MELETRSQRVGYIPTLNADDFPGDDFTNLVNASTGVESAVSDFFESRDKLPAELHLDEFRPEHAAKKLNEAEAKLRTAAEKTIATCERIGATHAREAAELLSKLTIRDAASEALAAPILSHFQSLGPAARVQKVHDMAKLLTTGDLDARQYLATLLAANRHLGLLSERDREFATSVLGRTKNPNEWARMEHLERGAKTVLEGAQRARQLIGGSDMRARLTNAS